MPKFSLYCSWELCAFVEVEAETREEAVRYANEEMPLPSEGVYVDSSFEVLPAEEFDGEKED